MFSKLFFANGDFACDMQERVPKQLDLAVRLAIADDTKKFDLEPLKSFVLDFHGEWNQRMVVGVGLVVLERHPGVSDENQKLVLTIYKAWLDKKVNIGFGKEFDQLKQYFTDMLAIEFAEVHKGNHLDTLNKMEKLVKPYMNVTDVRWILTNKERYHERINVVYDAIRDSDLGELFVGHLVGTAASKMFGDFLGGLLQKLDSKARHELTLADLHDLSTQASDYIEENALEEDLTVPRSLIATYRSFKLNLNVVSGADQTMTEKWAYVKSKGVGFGIPGLPFEQEICPFYEEPDKSKHMKEEVIGHIVRARTELLEALKGKTFSTLAGLLEHLDRNKACYKEDSTFSLDKAFYKETKRA